MNLSSLSFLQRLRSVQKQQYVVLGLGRFGRAVCSTLHQMGYEVLGIDSSESLITQALDDRIVSHAIQLDTTNRLAMEEAGVFDFETAIVAIGNYIEASVIATLNLKEAGVNYVLAKASSDIHGKLLRKVGADLVVFPEHEMGCQVGRSLVQPNILERLDLDANSSIVEVIVPQEFDGKSIAELQLRARYGINLLALSRAPVQEEADTGADRCERFDVNVDPSMRLRQGMVMVVIGNRRALSNLPI
ncbi:MAG: TrkA family potassium uptake protein [Cyanobacteria bacterium]|nr:TrkA family potassium uptake protein [Cyanobacteriota bacterium]